MSNGGKALAGAASGAAAGAALGPWGMAGGAAIGAIPGLFEGDDQANADAARQAALQRILSINAPSIDEQKVALEKYVSAGQLSPVQAETILQQNSGMSNISVDPRLKGAQMTALAKMQQMGKEGLTAEDRVTLNNTRNEVNQQDQARRQSILQGMAARGMAGSGAELAAQLQSAQAGTQAAAQSGDNTAAMAMRRSLDAISNAGQLGGQMNSQEFSQQAQQAQAQDAINRMNASNRQSVINQNVGSQNRAQELNLQNAQRLSDSNTGVANEQEMHNKGLYQTQFQNQMAKATVGASEGNTIGAADDRSAQRNRDMLAGVGKGLTQGATAAAGKWVTKPLKD